MVSATLENKSGGYKTGLIVVNLQHARKPPPCLVESIQKISQEYDIVVATQFLNKKLSLFETELGYKESRFGSVESEIILPLRPKNVFDRYSYGLQSTHIERLREYPVQRWDIVGCDTDAGVLATCYNLWDNGIKFRVMKELCHSSGGPEVHNAALTIMKRSFGQ